MVWVWEQKKRNVRVMIVSLLAEKEGRVMDIWTNVLVVLATPLWAVCLIIIMFSYVIWPTNTYIEKKKRQKVSNMCDDSVILFFFSWERLNKGKSWHWLSRINIECIFNFKASSIKNS
jgi:hypothetical protein